LFLLPISPHTPHPPCTSQRIAPRKESFFRFSLVPYQGLAPGLRPSTAYWGVWTASSRLRPHGLGSTEADASGYGVSRDMGQVGKEWFGTVGTNEPLFFRTRGAGGVREKMAYFRQGYRQIDESRLGVWPHQDRPVGRTWPNGEGVTGTAWVRPGADLRLYGRSRGGKSTQGFRTVLLSNPT
jgi:hypothetical protein